MRKYDSYKDSGIEWIGEIPSHWGVKKTKVIGKTLAGGTPSTDNPDFWNGDIPWLQSGKVQNNIIVPEDVDKYITELGLSKSATKMISANAVLVALTGATCGNVGLLTFNSTANQSVVGIEFKKSYIPKFNYYQFLSIREQILISKSGGAQGGVSEEVIKNLITVQPTPEEQTAIAAYLDRKTAEIDELIADKKRLLELYEEEKTAIINQAVTKGINPDVPMKDSGIEWLGEIPEHWEVKKLRHIKAPIKNSFVDGPFGSNLKTEHFIENGDVYVIDSGFITSGEFEFNREFKSISYEHFLTVNRSECTYRDIIIAKIGANFGMSGILPNLDKPSLVSGNTLKLTVNQELYDVDFIHKQLLCLKWAGEIDLLVKGSAQPALSMGPMSELSFAIPNSLREQQSIVRHIETECASIDSKKAKTLKLIDLLTEYRTALISEVVTGKIKVIE